MCGFDDDFRMWGQSTKLDDIVSVYRTNLDLNVKCISTFGLIEYGIYFENRTCRKGGV